jgi:hypothetical protein
METIYVVYKTDTWHSYASRDIIGIATSEIIAIDLCKQQAKKESCKLSKDQLWNLGHIKQTQGYAGEGEFQFEVVATNKLI